MSPSSRRAWIEIARPAPRAAGSEVALLAEGVDRNISGVSSASAKSVALLAEGVDRNLALLASFLGLMSPSSRRAWIEISCGSRCGPGGNTVALLAEGVDRNRT